MAKIRVYELAKRLSIPKEETLQRLKALGVEAKSTLSSVDEHALEADPSAGTRPAAAPGGTGTSSRVTTKAEISTRTAGGGLTSVRPGAASLHRKPAAASRPRAALARAIAFARAAAPMAAKPAPSAIPPAAAAALAGRATAAGPAGARTSVASAPAAATEATRSAVAPALAGPAPAIPGASARPSALTPVHGPPLRASGAGITRPAITVPRSAAVRLVFGPPPAAPLAPGARAVAPAAPGKAAAPAALSPPVASPKAPSAPAAPPQAPLRVAAPAASPAPAARGPASPAKLSRPPVPPTRIFTPSARPFGPGRHYGRTPMTAWVAPSRSHAPPRRTAGPAAARTTAAAPPAVAPSRAPVPAPPPVPAGPLQAITISEGATVKELAEKMGVKSRDLIRRLLDRGVLTTINQTLNTEGAVSLCREFNFEARVITFEEEAVHQTEGADLSAGRTLLRPPVATIMGHVDHGKTTLLDAIRRSNIVAGEHGGITQHIGAYRVDVKGRSIVFLDTPGHEAFTKMRARGAKVTDIVLLVVASDDGVQPQTIEAIHHARAAGVPIVVAINKIDKPDANPERVKQALSEQELLVRDWGGQIESVPISARQRTGIDDLLDTILLVADADLEKELEAHPDRRATGTILEAKLDRTRGAVATVLVRDGTLRIGDPFIAGAVHGKVRAMFDDRGAVLKQAGPSIPVEVLGLTGVPLAGDPFQVVTEEAKARQIGSFRQLKLREERVSKSARLTLQHLHERVAEGSVKELPIILKGDVQGSVEVLTKTLQDLSSDSVKIKVLHAAPGAITESDVLLASASNAIIVGFTVRPERKATELAEKEGVDIRLHNVIYEVSDEIRKAMTGLLEPTIQEVYLGRAEVRQIFKVRSKGVVGGSYVIDGRIARSANIRLLRDNAVVYKGRISSLRHLKDDVSEVKQEFECGIMLDKFNDLKVGDIVEAFRTESVPASA